MLNEILNKSNINTKYDIDGKINFCSYFIYFGFKNLAVIDKDGLIALFKISNYISNSVRRKLFLSKCAVCESKKSKSKIKNQVIY